MIMKLHYVVELLLWGVCMCDISDKVKIIANQTVDNPEDCIDTKCPGSPDLCSRAFFSPADSTCLFLSCDEKSCDLFLQELGNKPPNKEPRADPHQPSSDSPKSPVSPTQTALPVSLPPSAAPVSLPVPPPPPIGQNSSDTGNTSSSSSDNTTITSSQGGDQGQVLNQTLQLGNQGQIQPNSSMDEVQGQNKTLDNGHQGQPSVTPSVPAPPSPPLPGASVGAGNISSTVSEDQNETRVNKTDQQSSTTTTTTTTTTTAKSTTIHTTSSTTISTSTSSAKPVLPTNSTTVSTVTPRTTSTTANVTPRPSSTQTKPASTTPSPPTPPPSTAPPSLPSVTPRSSTTPRIPDVTSDQDKAIVETAGGELEGHLVNTSSLIAVLIFGLLFFVVTVILFLRHAYESYKRRGYTQMDYLINGMYSDSGL